MMTRKLDVLVAQRVMGQTAYCVGGYAYITNSNPQRLEWLEEAPRYSTDIAAAWEVVEKMGKLIDGQPGNALNYLTLSHNGDGYSASFCHPFELDDVPEWWECAEAIPHSARGSVAPLAICLAALRAAGVSEDEIRAALKEGDE